MIDYLHRLRSVEREIFQDNIWKHSTEGPWSLISSLHQTETPLITHFKIHIISQLVKFVRERI